MRSFANWARVVVVALSLGAGSLGGGAIARADAPAGGSIPPGWVWQGVWQDGRWQGQWIPGPGAPQPGGYQQSWGGDPEALRMAERCREHHHDGVATGAVIGGVVGGVIGNRVASGNRLAGTLGGAAVGAAAGAAIASDGKHRRDRDCEAFFHDHPEFAQGLPAGPPPYGPAPYGAMPYAPMVSAPMGYMMVPVITAPQPPCVETRTVTTTYIVEKRRHVVWTQPRRKEKRVYTGS